MKKKYYIVIFIVLTILVLTIVNSTINFGKLKSSIMDSEGDRIHFLNVGAADATIIESNGEYALIDTATETSGKALSSDDGYIKKILGDNKFKYIILTHDHSDHAGGLAEITAKFTDSNTIFYFGIRKNGDGNEVPISDYSTLSVKRMYNTLTELAHNGGKAVQLISESGKNITPIEINVGNFKIALLNMENDKKNVPNNVIPGNYNTGLITPIGDLNKDSIVELVTHTNGKKVLLTGDIQVDDEYRLLCKNSFDECRYYNNQKGIDYIGEVDIYSMGHHGTYTSNSIEFLDALNPSDVIASRGDKIEYTDIPYGSVDAFIYLDDKANIYNTSFDINNRYYVESDYDDVVRKADKEAIIATFDSSGYTISSSGYDLSKALMNNDFTHISTSGDWQKWNVYGKEQWIYLPSNKGVYRKRWSIDNNGAYFLSDRNTKYSNGWHSIKDGSVFKVFYFDENGYRKTGQINIDGYVYYLNNEGLITNYNGFITDFRGKKLYIENSYAVSGFKEITNEGITDTYYFSADWCNSASTHDYYYGEMYSDGFNKIDNHIYYFNEDGKIAKDTTIDGYNVNSSGYLVSSFITIDYNDYYCDEMGSCINAYRITYNCGEGAEGDAPEYSLAVVGSYYQAPKNVGTCSKPGYIFKGWNTKKDGSGLTFWNGYDEKWCSSCTNTRYGIRNNKLNLYATWEEDGTTFKTGSEVNELMKTLSSGQQSTTSSLDSNITSIEKVDTLPELTSITYETVSTSESPEPIYMWYDNGIIKWFSNSEKVYLNSDSSEMFKNLTAITTIDLTLFDNNKLTTINDLFSGCIALTTIYISPNESINATGTNVFNGCTSLVGELGTTYDINNVNESYARLDRGDLTHGYFSLKNNTVQITFDPNGGTVAETTIIIDYGTQIETYPVPTRDGYNFGGWYDINNMDQAVGIYNCFDVDTVLIAKWIPITKILTYNANGGNLNERNIIVVKGTTITDIPTPIRDNYIFEGWYTSLDYSQKIEDSIVLNENTTLYAKWDAIDLIVLDDDYITKEDQTIIVNIPTGIKLDKSKLLTMIDVPRRSIFRDKNNNEIVSDSSGVGTGSTIVFDDTTYTIVVKGDINGDGELSIIDLINIYGYMNEIDKGIQPTLNQNQITACDFIGDNMVDILDLINVYNRMNVSD